MPVQSKNPHGESSKPNAEEFARFLGDIFASEVGHWWKKRQLTDFDESWSRTVPTML